MDNETYRALGHLEGKVESLEEQVAAMATKIDSLLELANKSRGAFWLGIGLASTLGGCITLLVELFWKR